MRFSVTASALAALASSALAQTEDFNPIYSPQEGEVLEPGTPYEITWQAPDQYSTGTVCLSVIGGADQNTLEPLLDIACGVPNSANAYDWDIPEDIEHKDVYGIVITLESDTTIFQYSQPFQVKPGNGEGNYGKPTKVITTSTGIKTVSLSSCPPTTTPSATPTYVHNTTSTLSTSTRVSTTPVYTPEPSAPATTPVVTVPEVTTEAPVQTPTDAAGAGAHLVAGPAALVGALAVAFFAL